MYLIIYSQPLYFVEITEHYTYVPTYKIGTWYILIKLAPSSFT